MLWYPLDARREEQKEAQCHKCSRQTNSESQSNLATKEKTVCVTPPTIVENQKELSNNHHKALLIQ